MQVNRYSVYVCVCVRVRLSQSRMCAATEPFVRGEHMRGTRTYARPLLRLKCRLSNYVPNAVRDFEKTAGLAGPTGDNNLPMTNCCGAGLRFTIYDLRFTNPNVIAAIIFMYSLRGGTLRPPPLAQIEDEGARFRRD